MSSAPVLPWGEQPAAEEARTDAEETQELQPPSTGMKAEELGLALGQKVEVSASQKQHASVSTRARALRAGRALASPCNARLVRT